MKTMNMNLKSAMLVCAALIAGFTSCNNDNEEAQPPVSEVNAKEHSIVLKVNVGAATRAEETGTAVGKTPTLTDLTLFFANSTTDEVTLVHAANVSTIATTSGESITAIPGGTNTIYAIGNLSKVPSASIAAITDASTESQLKAALIDVTSQLSAGTPSYEHVNLYGYVTYFVPVGNTSATASMDIYPAVSRLEIAQVEADVTPAEATNKISAYSLDGIFINNTYKGIGVDPAIYGTAGNALAYASNDAIWTTDITTYPASFCNYYSPAKNGSLAYTPDGGAKWAYFVAPAAKQVNGYYVGEVIGGAQYDAKPVIVVKISGVTYDGGYTGIQYDPAYITITKLKNGATYLDHFERGNVYDISNIKFDASHLTGSPMIPPVYDIAVNVAVKPWVGITTEPEL